MTTQIKPSLAEVLAPTRADVIKAARFLIEQKAIAREEKYTATMAEVDARLDNAEEALRSAVKKQMMPFCRQLVKLLGKQQVSIEVSVRWKTGGLRVTVEYLDQYDVVVKKLPKKETAALKRIKAEKDVLQAKRGVSVSNETLVKENIVASLVLSRIAADPHGAVLLDRLVSLSQNPMAEISLPTVDAGKQ